MTAPGTTTPRLLVVLGTNASGKSDLGVDLALALGGEVVSADSRQVYRGLDLGTGKLSLEERRGVAHHLIDVADVETVYSVADFQRDAYRAVRDIAARGRQPLLVGGTGLYVDAVTEGYQLTGVRPDPARRGQLEAEDTDTLARRLQALDPSALASLDVRNRRRLVRAIEVAESGVTYAHTRARRPQFATLKLGLTWPRDVLRTRIHERLVTRLDQGMVQEVERLLAQGVSQARLHELGLEYRYVARHLDGELDRDELVDELGRAIYRFARRQLSWFRRHDDIHWLDTGGDWRARAVDVARAFADADSRA